MKLYNTLTRKTEELGPLTGKKVKLYTCGLTVYSQPHIGNWLGYIYWDVLVRALKAEGYEVERTQNITDVGHLTSDDDSGEDKMEKGARTEGTTAWDVAAKYIAVAEHEGYELLGLERPDHLVRATDYIEQQIAFAKILEDKGYTYVIPDDGLYFDTSKLDDYGKLARLDIAGLEPGARVPVEGKKNPTDFAVWKFSHEGVKRDMEWDSPWGKGFPGWHLECSVIARETLGDQIDIHTGGIDHIPVHHTNEIAQTEAVTGKQFSQFWVHNNHLKADGQKMSKSVGNIYTLQDILDKGYSMDAFRVFVLSKHYTTEGNFTWENLEAAQNRLDGWRSIADLRHQPTQHGSEYFTDTYVEAHKQAVLHSLSHNLDTVSALNEVETVMNDYTLSKRDESSVTKFDTFLSSVNEMLGLNLLSPDIAPEQKQLLEARTKAREAKDWTRSDTLRDQLAEQGIVVRDTADGQVWAWK